jgi:hypothetical protein
MQCPGCHQDALSIRHRLRVALRARTLCPACGIVIRFGFWPRLLQSLLGDAVVLGGAAAALWLQAPFWIPLAVTSWSSFALLLPLQAGPKNDA